MSEVLGHKAPPGPRNNTWPNREQSEQGVFGVLGDTMPFDPAGEVLKNFTVCNIHVRNAVYHVGTYMVSEICSFIYLFFHCQVD